MTAREREGGQTEPFSTAHGVTTYSRSAPTATDATRRKVVPDERTGPAERRVASYRWCIETIIDHAIGRPDESEIRADVDAMLSTLRRPTVTEEELAEAMDREVAATCNVSDPGQVIRCCARVALEVMGRKG